MAGVTDEEVARAANELLIEGVRPSIEKVRARLKRGSPNTVGPYLDKWFKDLARRVADVDLDQRGDGLPAGVRNAMRLLWDTALREAGAVASMRLAAQEAAADAREQAAAQKERDLESARAGMEEALRQANARADDLRRQLQEGVSSFSVQ